MSHWNQYPTRYVGDANPNRKKHVHDLRNEKLSCTLHATEWAGNTVSFPTRQEAYAAGYTPCLFCLPHEKGADQPPAAFARCPIDVTILKGQFLVAMPQLRDPNFEQTVVLLCDHGHDGALGLVVNRPTPFTLEDIYEGQHIEGKGGSRAPVHYGGPVQPEMGFVLFEGGEYEGSLAAVGNVQLGTSLEILRDIAADRGPSRFLFCLGYAGWAPEQLEQELARNDWLVVPATPRILFEVPAEKRWDQAIRALGIDPGMLSAGFGTA